MSSDGVGMDARCVQLSLATTAPLDPDEEMRRAVWTVKADAESVLAAEGGCTKLLHCVRHGQGLHNVDRRYTAYKDSSSPVHGYTPCYTAHVVHAFQRM
eukprot:6179786-Pleurochrysis_carterae.AAC.6